MSRITEQRQHETYLYILQFAADNGRTPTFDEIQKNCGQSSKGTVANDIRRLVDSGLIDQEQPSGRIVVRNTDSSRRHFVPLIGSFRMNSEQKIVEDVNGTYELPNALFGHNDSQFLFRAMGDSMVEKRIYDGDILLVDRAKVGKDGDIVIALVANEVTCKVLATDSEGKRYLKAANSAKDAFGNRIFDIHPETPWQVLGIVRNIIVRL